MSDRDPEVALQPCEADLCVLFCDLRAFSSRSEQSSDNLLGLLDDVSSAISIMTRCILEHGGVIGDFRAPDIMRFGFTPLYLGEEDVLGAVEILEDVMVHRRWDNTAYQRRAAVT